MSVTRKTTTYGIVARDAPTAVIFRRGPTRHTRMLVWNLRDDTIRAGQWLIGRVDPGPCGLSPNGELLIYEARKGPRTFTAICRPPFFTALAFWEYSLPWTGGGFFATDTTVVLGLPFENPRAAGDFPDGFQVTSWWSYFGAGMKPPDLAKIQEAVCADPAANQGWLQTGRKPNPVHQHLRLERIQVGRDERAYSMIEDARSSNGNENSYDLSGVDWADWAPDGTLLFGQAGRLCRQEVPRSLTDALEPPRLIADLTNQSFEHIFAPHEAHRWPPKIRRAARARLLALRPRLC